MLNHLEPFRRRLHLQLRADTVKDYKDQLDGTNIVHLQEAESRPTRQVSGLFKNPLILQFFLTG